MARRSRRVLALVDRIHDSLAPRDPMRALVLLSSVLVLLPAARHCAGEPLKIHASTQQTLADTGRKLVRLAVKLPPGRWRVIEARTQLADGEEQELFDAHLLSPSSPGLAEGRRMHAATVQSQIRAGRQSVASVYWQLLRYAREHDGRTPERIEALANPENLLRLRRDGPWAWRRNGQTPQGPFFQILPARFEFDDDTRRTVRDDKRQIVVVELRPYIDDGKHWVQYTDGTAARVEIDAELVRQHKLKIRPIHGRDTFQSTPSGLVDYQVLLGVKDADRVRVRIEEPIREQSHWIQLDLRENLPSSDSILADLQRARQQTWQPYMETGAASVLAAWHSATSPKKSVTADARRGRTTNMFSLLGGRAAIDETLQMQDLVTSGNSAASRSVAIEEIQGVEVKAHPYKEMLGDARVDGVELANYVPHDRLLVYVPQPAALVSLLDGGGAFATAMMSGTNANQLDFGLQDRYLASLGISRAWLESALREDLVEALAISAPDLFFVDGTDLTVVAKLKDPDGFTSLPSGSIPKVRNGHTTEVVTARGRAWWSLQGDLLLISTHRDEMERALRLVRSQGSGSLGKSNEFRYMLTKLAPSKRTQAFVYFSDPFVRRLVGPEVKIAQRRRVLTRQRMETLTSLSLLARLDGHADSASWDSLQQYHEMPTAGLSWDEQGVLVSQDYGSLHNMRTLLDVPVRHVSSEEAEAYRRYRDAYEQYWRQFFDPIAVRLNAVSGGEAQEMELEIFILPLIDSSIYNTVRALLHGFKDGRPLIVPQLEPRPVVQFSLNMREEAWLSAIRSFSSLFGQYSGVSTAVLDDLGPSVHLAVMDSDPVIALGEGDLFGAFGGNVMRSGGTMLMIPVALSILTRPCTLMIETQDPDRTARYFRESARASRQDGRRERGVLYQSGDQDAWVWSMNFAGVVNLRFGIEVDGRYLIVRNIPWSAKDRLVGEQEAFLKTAQLSVNPEVCQVQVASLFASTAERERQLAMRSLSRLYPLIVSGAANLESAAEVHRQLYGFAPVHPRRGNWTWVKHRLRSSVYGSIDSQRQPPYDPQQSFGFLSSIQRVRLNMQFEDEGLRSRVKWQVQGTR